MSKGKWTDKKVLATDEAMEVVSTTFRFRKEIKYMLEQLGLFSRIPRVAVLEILIREEYDNLVRRGKIDG